MTDAFYKDIRDTVADDLLVEFGAAMTLREKGGDQVFNGATGFVTTEGTDVEYPITGMRTQYKRNEVDGTNIKDEDFKILMSAVNRTTGIALTVVPDTSMLIVDGAKTYTIINADPLIPGNINVMYTLQVRH